MPLKAFLAAALQVSSVCCSRLSRCPVFQDIDRFGAANHGPIPLRACRNEDHALLVIGLADRVAALENQPFRLVPHLHLASLGRAIGVVCARH